MEQLLNISWLLIVAGIVLGTRARPHRSRYSTRWLFVAIVVFACVAVLLFPVISATDDLHPGSDLSDDAAWRHAARAVGMIALAFVSLVLITMAPVQARQLHTLASTGTVASTQAGYVRVDAGRAPPRCF